MKAPTAIDWRLEKQLPGTRVKILKGEQYGLQYYEEVITEELLFYYMLQELHKTRWRNQVFEPSELTTISF